MQTFLPCSVAAVPAARVTRRSGYREAGNILIGDALGVFQAFHIVAQTAAQHHADLRPAAGGFDRVGGSLQSLHIFFRGHFHFSFHFGEGDGETLPPPSRPLFLTSRFTHSFSRKLTALKRSGTPRYSATVAAISA